MPKSILYAGIIACLSMSACRTLEQRAMPEREGTFQLFLLIGQSNMAGRGIVADEDRQAYANILTLNKDEAWVPAVDPIHFDKPVAGVGPGRSFALAVIREQPDVTVGLIPSAVGGSPISSWEPGALDEATHTHPYDDAVRRTRKAMESGTLKAVLWHQGESDSNEELAPLYKEKLVALIGRLRQEFGDPALPFLIGQLGSFSERPWDDWKLTVNKAHEEVATELEAVFFIPADGLGHKGDNLHFSAEAARELGGRFARVYNEEVH